MHIAQVGKSTARGLHEGLVLVNKYFSFEHNLDMYMHISANVYTYIHGTYIHTIHWYYSSSKPE